MKENELNGEIWARPGIRFVFVVGLTLLSCGSPPPADERAALGTTVERPLPVSSGQPAPVASVPLAVSQVDPNPDSTVAQCVAGTAGDSVRRVQNGARLFVGKGCTRCHTIGDGYREGPDLEGVAKRQGCEWVVALLIDTENMIQTDPELQQLRIEHFLDMPNHHLSVAEALELYAYLRAAPIDSTRKQDKF